MPTKEIFGFIGGAFITIAMIPQVYRLFKLKSAHEISLTFTLLFLVGGLFWLTYGILTNSPSITYANSVNIVLVALMLFAKLKWGKEPANEKHP